MKKVVILDNADSFTWNIVDYLRRINTVDYKVISTHQTTTPNLTAFDKIIISPGPGLPKDFPLLFDIIDQYYQTKSILGICLGHQAICEYCSGELMAISPVYHGQSSRIEQLEPSDLFFGLPKKFRVGLYHSWAVREQSLTPAIKLLAKSEHNIVMAIKMKDFDVQGLQFHPESYITEHGLQLFRNFVIS